MNEPQFESLVGQTKIKDMQRPTTGSFVQLLGETYYRISHSDQIPSFFMSVVGGADHWLFITSNGGLTAGRVNPDSALFLIRQKTSSTHNANPLAAKPLFTRCAMILANFGSRFQTGMQASTM